MTWQRLGVLEDDFDDFDLLRLPVKTTDKRAAGFREKYGDECAELDAIPPKELRRRVEKAILEHIDADEWARLQRVEQVEKETMQAYVAGWVA